MATDPLTLEGKTIVVTGSASGMGYETARLVSQLGGTVLGVDINKNFDHVEEFYRADLSDPRTIDALLDVLPDGIDGIANVAGLAPSVPVEKVLNVNLFGLKRLTLAMIPKLNDGASIVNLASTAGFDWAKRVDLIRASETVSMDQAANFALSNDITNEGGRSYFFSKEALVVWTMQNRWTWRDRGIRMNAVSPGPVETPLLPAFLESFGDRASANMDIMDRYGRPEDVAPVVAFLLSDMTKWMRGAIVPVDGGMSAHMACTPHGL